MLWARPQHSDAPAKTTTDARKKRRRPYRPLNLPASGSINTMPTEYAVIDQLVQLMDAWSPCCIACSAVATMVPSSELINSPSATTAKIATRRGASGLSTFSLELTEGTGALD